MTDLELLQASKTRLLTALAANAGKPSYDIDGQQVSWGDLMDQLASVNEALAVIQGPIEETSQGY